MAAKFIPIASVLEIANQDDISDYDMRLFYWKLSYYGGVAMSRCFPDWKTRTPGIHPHLKAGSRFSLFKVNQKWLDRLIWIRDNAMAPVGIKMLLEVFDGCAQRSQYGWSAWVNNIEGVRNVFELSDKAMKARKHFIDAVYEVLGDTVEYSLVNEASLPRGNCERWTYDMAEYMRSKRMVRPEVGEGANRKRLYFSGGTGPDGLDCGHKMSGTLSDEVPDSIQPIPYQWPNDGAIRMIHNVGKPSQVPDLFTCRKLYHVFSHDGCNFKDDPEHRGHCEIINGQAAWCGPSRSSARKTMDQAVKVWGAAPRWGNLFAGYEALPREVQVEGKVMLVDLDLDLTCRPFVGAYRKAYGMDPKNYHKYPRPKK
jgi:hypothetical protein